MKLSQIGGHTHAHTSVGVHYTVDRRVSARTRGSHAGQARLRGEWWEQAYARMTSAACERTRECMSACSSSPHYIPLGAHPPRSWYACFAQPMWEVWT